MIPELSPRAADLEARVRAFMDEHVYAAEPVFREQLDNSGNRWRCPPIMAELKAKAKAQGLWNLFLPQSERGAGLSNRNYAPICAVMGRSPIGAEACNRSEERREGNRCVGPCRYRWRP